MNDDDALDLVSHLTVSWGVSRGRETDGYAIARLRDDTTGKVYRCMGGGYDMVGTVFGAWLQDVHQDALIDIRDQAHRATDGGRTMGEGLYGMRVSVKPGTARPVHVYLDGASGLESMLAIARAIGLGVRKSLNRRGEIDGFTVVRAEHPADCRYCAAGEPMRHTYEPPADPS